MAFRTESKKASKRNLENIAYTGEIFENFNSVLDKLSEKMGNSNRNHLPLIDLLSRFERICAKMEETPKPLLFNYDKMIYI